MQFLPPSKQQIKDKYKISNQDFDILVKQNIPEPKELLAEESLLEKAADYLGVPTFLKKHRKTGIILAIIFLPGWFPPVYQNTKNIVVTTYNFYESKVQYLTNKIDDKPTYLVYYKEPSDMSVEGVNFIDMPIASGITGISGTDVNMFPKG